MNNQNYALFWDEKNKEIFGEVNSITGKGNPNYHIKNFWTEDLLVILWIVLNGYISWEDSIHVWDNMYSYLTTYETSEGEIIDTPLTYVGSNHEIGWGMNFLPYSETKLFDLFFNSQYVQADYARKNNLPGFLAVAYDGFGTYAKIGLSEIAQRPSYIQRQDNAVCYSTCMPYALMPEKIWPWLEGLLNIPSLGGYYGLFESIGPEGSSDVLTADSQFTIASSLSGGVIEEVKKYLKRHKNKWNKKDLLTLFYVLFERKYKTILQQKPTDELFLPQKPTRYNKS